MQQPQPLWKYFHVPLTQRKTWYFYCYLQRPHRGSDMLPSTSTLGKIENLSGKIVALFIIYISNGDLTKLRRRRITRTKPFCAENSWPILVQNQPFALSAWALWWTFTLVAHFCKCYALGWKWCDRSDDQSDKGSDDLIMRLMILVFNSLNVTWLEGIDDRDGEITKTNNERQYFTNITICYLAQYFANITSS